MHAMTLEIVRRPDLPTIHAACDVMQESLGFAYTEAFSRDASIEAEGPQHFRVAVDRTSGRDRGVVAVLTCQPGAQFFGEASLSTGAIRCVGVAPEVRGKGVLRALLGDTLAELREAGVPLSMLYASNPRVYRAFGYEYAGTKIAREASTSDLAEIAAPGPKLRIEPLGPDRDALVGALYARVAPSHDGWLDRGPFWWWRIRNRPTPSVPPRAYGFFREGALEGYVLLKPSLGAPSRLHVADLVCETGDALQTALTLIHGHRSIFPTFDWLTGAADPISLLLPVLAERVGPPPSPYAQGPIEPWLICLVDPAAALARRGYRRGLALDLRLRVTGRSSGDGDRCLGVRIEGGRAEVRAVDSASLTVDARALASLYGCYYGVDVLAAAGLVEGDRAARAALASMFAGEMAWMQDHF
jgi:predicted acetyltransferase